MEPFTRRRRALRVALPALIAVHAGRAGVASAQQQEPSDVSLSPSLSFPTSPGTGTLAGLGLIMSGSPGFALRASGNVALKNTYGGGVGAARWLPPWSADADAVFTLSGRPFGSRNRSAGSFAFIGIGTSAVDSSVVRTIGKNWSYGLGTMLPLGQRADLFAESRWRIAHFVLPTANPKPARPKEFRFGLTFHLPASEQRGWR